GRGYGLRDQRVGGGAHGVRCQVAQTVGRGHSVPAVVDHILGGGPDGVVDAFGQAGGVVIGEVLLEEGAQRYIELLIGGGDQGGHGGVGNEAFVDGGEAGVGHGGTAGGCDCGGVGGGVEDEVDAGDVGAVGSGVDDLGGPGAKGDGVRGCERRVGVAGGDEVDAADVAGQGDVLTGGSGGVGAGMGQRDDHLDSLDVAEVVDQVLDGGVIIGREIGEGDGRGHGSVGGCVAAHEPDVADARAVREGLDPSGLHELAGADVGGEVGTAVEAHV